MACLGDKYRFYFLEDFTIPRSRQIFFARLLSISVCRGTVEIRRVIALKNTLCDDPSRISVHPSLWRCLRSSIRFIYAGSNTRSGSRSACTPASLRLMTRLVSRTSTSASSRFLRTSGRVRPCVFTPESSSIQPRYHLPLFLYTAVNCCFIMKYYHVFYNLVKHPPPLPLFHLHPKRRAFAVCCIKPYLATVCIDDFFDTEKAVAGGVNVYFRSS